MEEATSYGTKIFTTVAERQNDRYSSVTNTQCDHKSRTCLARQNWTAVTMANVNQDKLQSNTRAYRCSDLWNGSCSTHSLSGVLYCIARVYSDVFQRNVTASISTENLAHIYAAITVSQLMCQLHKKAILWTLNSHLLHTNPVPSSTDLTAQNSLKLYT